MSGHLGWQSGRDGFLIGDKFLVSEKESVVPVTFKGYEAGNNQIAKGFTKQGSYDAWVAGVNQLFGFPLAVLATVIPIIHAAIPELKRDRSVKTIIEPLWDTVVRQRSMDDFDQAKAALQQEQCYSIYLQGGMQALR